MSASIDAQFPIPITILTGFLGAGKTSMLNHILHSDHGLRVAVLVNDFGSINIDSQLVVGVEGETVSLSNGCICCTIRDDLLNATINLINRPEPPQYIVIETSGVSDPAAVAQTFILPEVRPYMRVDSILTVVDAEQGGNALDGEEFFLAMDQVGVADIVVLNKIDLATPERLNEMRDWVRQIVPNARVIETTHGKIPFELVLGVGKYDPERLHERSAKDIHVHEAGVPSDHDHHDDHDHEHGEHDHQHDHSLVFETWSWSTGEQVSYKALRKAIDALPTTIFRAKGVLNLADVPDRRSIIQVVGKRVSLVLGEEWGDETPRTQIVVIGQYGGVDAGALTAQFDKSLMRLQPSSEIQRITKAAMEWLRSQRERQN